MKAVLLQFLLLLGAISFALAMEDDGEEEKPRRVDVRKLPEEDSPFFDLSAKDRTGKTIPFSRFEGYYTVLATVPRVCETGAAEKVYRDLEHIHAVYPYSYDIVAFPLATTATPEEGCAAHKTADEKPGRKITIMEELQGAADTDHAIVAFLKETFQLDGLDDSHPTYFLISPSGSHLEIHERSRMEQVLQQIKLHQDMDL